MNKIVIRRQFCGPPNSGNGGYVCGVLARDIVGPATAVLRAPIPLDVELALADRDEGRVLLGEGDVLIGQAGPGRQALPEPPPAPSLEAAREASTRCIGLQERVHPICFTCGEGRAEGDGLRVFPGQLANADPGVVACVWTPHAAFADDDGRIAPEYVWAALDCPGIFAWMAKTGRQGALLGTMTGEITKPVQSGADYIVLAWPLEAEGRKRTAGVALFDAEGPLVARAHQVWITMTARPPGAI